MDTPVQVKLYFYQRIFFSAFSYHRFKNLVASSPLETSDMACINMVLSLYMELGFPGVSDGKESACSVGDLYQWN